MTVWHLKCVGEASIYTNNIDDMKWKNDNSHVAGDECIFTDDDDNNDAAAADDSSDGHYNTNDIQ